MKKRTLNEYRQTKDCEYSNPKVNKLSIKELCKMYPNNADLGAEIRKDSYKFPNFVYEKNLIQAKRIKELEEQGTT